MTQPQHVFREATGFSGRWNAAINTYEHSNYEGWLPKIEKIAKLQNVEFYYTEHRDTGMKVLELTVDYLDATESGEEKHYVIMYSVTGMIRSANSSTIDFSGTILKGIIVEAATRKFVSDLFAESDNKQPLVNVRLMLKK